MLPKNKSSSIGGADSDGDADLSTHSAMHSAATTQPSSPRPLSELFPPCTASSLPWEKIRQRLFQMALDGNEDVAYYGDIISDRSAIERFLSAAKGNVDKATEQMRLHLQWRRKFQVDDLPGEDFSDLKAHGELYWAGCDNQGIPTMTWILRKHDAARTSPERFVRFLIHQIEVGMRSSPQYPNTPFNIIVDLADVGLGNNDTDMAALLQKALVQNYPKVRKALYVFPVNWFVHLFWDTIIKPILSTLQPDIEDKICPLTGDFEAKLRERFPRDQIEKAYGGDLDLVARGEPPVLPYQPVSVKSMLRQQQRPAPVQSTSAAGGAAPAVSAAAEASPSTTTLRAAQKLVREEQRVRRQEARTRHVAAEGEDGEKGGARGTQRRRASGGSAVVQACLACVVACVGWVWAGEVGTAGPALGAAVVTGVAAAVGAVVVGGKRGGGNAGRDEKAVVARAKRERAGMHAGGTAESTSWMGSYAQVCGF